MAPAIASATAFPAAGDPLSELLPLDEGTQSIRPSKPLALEPRPLLQSLHALDGGLSGEGVGSRPAFTGYRDALGAVLLAISASDCGGGADAAASLAVDGRGDLLVPASSSDRGGRTDDELVGAGCTAPLRQRKARRTAAPHRGPVLLPEPPASARPTGGPEALLPLAASLLPIDTWEGEGSLGSPHEGGGGRSIASPLRGFGAATSLEGSGEGISLVTPLDAGGELPLQGAPGPADEGADWHGASSVWDTIPVW